MKEINYQEAMALVADRLAHGGIFLTVGGEKPNTMTIGWGALGVCWGKPVFTVYVRPQRHTYGLLKAASEFTVSVPTRDPLRQELAYAVTASGRDEDKFSGHGLTAAPAQKVAAPIVKECGVHFECKVKLVQDMTEEQMDAGIAGKVYPGKDFHTIFMGEIVACYSTDE